MKDLPAAARAYVAAVLAAGAIVLATGADPVHLAMPGEPGPPVHYLRTLANSRAARFEIGASGGSGLPKPYELDAPNRIVRYREL